MQNFLLGTLLGVVISSVTWTAADAWGRLQGRVDRAEARITTIENFLRAVTTGQ